MNDLGGKRVTIWQDAAKISFDPGIFTIQMESVMRGTFWKSVALGIVILAGSTRAQAAQLWFNGTVLAPVADAGTAFSLTLAYTAGASFASIDSATLIIGTQKWGSLASGANQITIDASKTQMIIVANFAPSTPGNLGSTVANLTFNVTGNSTVPSQVASEANINALFSSQKSASGTFLLIPFAPPFSGPALTLAGDLYSVPEPTSGLFLSAIGIFAGCRYLRRRQLQRSASGC